MRVAVGYRRFPGFSCKLRDSSKVRWGKRDIVAMASPRSLHRCLRSRPRPLSILSPRSSLSLRYPLPPLPSKSNLRHASTKPSPSQPIVLEKPARFNPPSHPARRNRPPPRSYPGPPPSAREREERKTKRYPHMMPPEGTFMHWFLTNRSIHIWITMVRSLSSLLLINAQD